jgi:hypothetical protein
MAATAGLTVPSYKMLEMSHVDCEAHVVYLRCMFPTFLCNLHG